MSSTIQLYRTPSGRHPYMSRWSKNEPASKAIANCDHWCKLKHKASILTLKYGDGNTGVAFWTDYDTYEKQREKRCQLLKREHRQINNKLSAVGRHTFIETVICNLEDKMPGNNNPIRSGTRGVLRSSANDRARNGFRYWIVEKPTVHKGGKHTTGAKTSVLGIGKSFLP